MEQIDISTADGTADSLVARPDGSAHPGVLLFMDAIGVRPRIEQMAERIASWGYIVLVPNVFYRSGTAPELAPQADLTVPENREEFMSASLQRVRDLTDTQEMSDTRSYIDALHHQSGVDSGPIGTTGYCMGGKLSFLAACTFGDEIAAAAAFHAAGLATDDPHSPHLKASGASAELYFGHADQDTANPAEAISALDSALDAANVTYTSRVYSAPHGYTMSDIPVYDADATERHFDALRHLFRRTLG